MSSKERRQRETEQLRQKIIEHAALIIATEGYEGFTIRKLAKSIEYSPRTIYLHFRDKQHLMAEIVESGFGFSLAQMISDPLPGEPLRQLDVQIRRHIEAGLAHPEHYRVLVDLINREGFIPGVNQRRIEQIVFEQITSMVPEPMVHVYTDLLFSTLRGVTLSLISLRGKLSVQETDERITAYIEMIQDALKRQQMKKE
jgi:AcrR family transcriptional regulator